MLWNMFVVVYLGNIRGIFGLWNIFGRFVEDFRNIFGICGIVVEFLRNSCVLEYLWHICGILIAANNVNGQSLSF